jgi:DNA-binding IclR family transcriptional regulator
VWFELGKTEDQIIDILQKSGRPMTLVEIAEQAGKPPKKLFSPLRKLFEAGHVDCDLKSHTYQIAKH